MTEADIDLTGKLEAARAAYEADDSQTVARLCQEVVDVDPRNGQAWELLAKFGGWDAKMYVLDVDFAVEAATFYLGLLPETSCHDAAAEVYVARKHQIAKKLEADMMMPSYTGAKSLHETMGMWQRLLLEIPNLTAELIEDEIVLVHNLCMRSKLGIMPGDRLVYTAYASLNGKESYDETFRKALEARIAKERASNDAARTAVVERARERLDAYRAWVRAESPDAAARRYRLEEDIVALNAELEDFVGLSNRGTAVLQLEELQRQLAAMKPYKVFKRRELESQIAAQQERIGQIDTALEPTVKAVRGIIAQAQGLLGEADDEGGCDGRRG